jgi:hypothetical protein
MEKYTATMSPTRPAFARVSMMIGAVWPRNQGERA